MVPERALADDDARRVLAGVPGEPLELARLIEQLLDAGVAIVERLELRLDLERLGDRVRLGRRLARNEVRDLLRLRWRDAHAARHVLHHALALQLREGRDLTDARLAVLALDVGDDLVTPVHAEVDVEVRHAHALRIEEALEQKVVRNRIEIGDAHRVGDDRAGARAAAWAHGNSRLLRVANEVPHDEEVPGEVHLRDDVELRREARAVRRGVDALALRRELLDAALEPFARDVTEIPLGVVALGHDEAREHRLAELERHLATLRDLERGLHGLRVRREELRHLLGRLQVHLARAVVALLRLFERPPRLDARQIEVRLGVGALGVVDVVRGHERQLELAREPEQDAVDDRLLRQSVVLQLDVQAPRLERVAERREDLAAAPLALLEDGLRDQTAHAPRQPDEALRARRDLFEAERRALHVRARDEPDEVLVALGGGGEERQVLPVAAAARDVELASEDRLDLGLLRRLVQRDRPEHVAVVGDGDGLHSRSGDPLDQVFHLHRAVEQRILSVNVEVVVFSGHR